MIVLRFESWSIEFPEEWGHEIENDILSLVPPDEAGVLQVSSMSKESGPVGDTDLWDTMNDAGVDGADIERTVMGAFEGLAASANEDEIAVRYWILRNGNTLLLATFREAEIGSANAASFTAAEGVLKSLKAESEAPATLN
jgi:hypothetical protein